MVLVISHFIFDGDFAVASFAALIYEWGKQDGTY